MDPVCDWRFPLTHLAISFNAPVRLKRKGSTGKGRPVLLARRERTKPERRPKIPKRPNSSRHSSPCSVVQSAHYCQETPRVWWRHVRMTRSYRVDASTVRNHRVFVSNSSSSNWKRHSHRIKQKQSPFQSHAVGTQKHVWTINSWGDLNTFYSSWLLILTTHLDYSSWLLILTPHPGIYTDHTAFLQAIGRNCVQYATKIGSWQALMTASPESLKECGIGQAKTRKYLLKWIAHYK
jgi:hypothetical protein